MAKKLSKNQLLTRYALTGGAIGLYFGLFFRPARQPNLWVALALAGLVTVVMVGIEAWRKRPRLSQLFKTAVLTFIKTFLFLILLELRHPFYNAGGRVAVSLYMTLMGALAGLWYAYEQLRGRKKP
ncbi:MAG: hypothetical protein R6X34_30650 [Chloroflexota bacterium]